MSYVDRIPKEELSDYTVVEDLAGCVDVNNSLVLYKSIIKGTPKVPNGIKSILILNSYFISDLSIVEFSLSDLIISHSYFDNGLLIKEVEVIDEGVMSISECSVNGIMSIVQSSFYECSLSFFECKELDVQINKCKLIDITNGVDFNGKELLTKAVFSKLKISDCLGEFVLTNLSVDKFIVYGLKNGSALTLNNIIVNMLSLFGLVNIPLRLMDVRAIDYFESQIHFLNCSLTEAEFYKVDLQSFNNLILSGTNFTNTIFANVKWNFNIGKSTGDPHDQRETYRQLKYALGKQGDTINEQKFHTLEMRAHYKSLDWRTDGWNKAIIALSYRTGNFGQSIWWPIRALLVGHYWMYMLAIGAQAVQLNNYKVGWFNDYIYNYLYLINPLHKTEDLPKNWTIIIDIFMRIWSSYMIYNIIRASRRFIK